MKGDWRICCWFMESVWESDSAFNIFMGCPSCISEMDGHTAQLNRHTTGDWCSTLRVPLSFHENLPATTFRRECLVLPTYCFWTGVSVGGGSFLVSGIPSFGVERAASGRAPEERWGTRGRPLNVPEQSQQARRSEAGWCHWTLALLCLVHALSPLGWHALMLVTKSWFVSVSHRDPPLVYSQLCGWRFPLPWTMLFGHSALTLFLSTWVSRLRRSRWLPSLLEKLEASTDAPSLRSVLWRRL